ncbi:MAG: hypothetical protein A3G80_13485 [Betaproteobacteria bacterium RIFCSPLOWO2_12_FULL_62_13b]|nr:MAG: hypothetical protein A3G80_13485 [Betaproteobacteria bacterium RIFCSPLOWO2_12_FULL_62_13b]
MRLLLILALAMCSGFARADIYRYVDENGVVGFTNIPPNDRSYDVYLREAPPKALRESRQTPPLKARLHNAGNRARYAGLIEAAAQASQLEPALIHAVIAAESGYNPSALSPKGAVGLMQLMPQTAKRYSVTNPLDPLQNIQGGARYLRDLLRMFNNDLKLALAAYNAGENAVMKYGNRIPPFPETLAYVPRVLSYYRMYRASS